MKKENWVWMPHPGHFIGAKDCKFFMSTYVGKYIVSTVGEYFPDSRAREIYAQSRGIVLEGLGDERDFDYMKRVGYEEIGYGRTYETMVFNAVKSPDKDTCCPWRQESGRELDFDGYKTPEAAYAGHLAMCKKWAAK